jgi:hypothetical protein
VKSRRLRVALLVALVAAVAAAPFGYVRYTRITRPSFNEWLADVAAPDYELRYRSRTASHYVAVFQVGSDELAFCRKRVEGDDGAESRIRITDVAGNDLVALDRPQWKLGRKWDLGVAEFGVEDGRLYPIRRGYNGRMRISLVPDGQEVGLEPASDDPSSLGVLDVHIYWGKRR